MEKLNTQEKAWIKRYDKFGEHLAEEIDNNLETYFSKEKHNAKYNAIEKNLVREFLIKMELKKVLRLSRKFDISKGVVTKGKGDKLKDSGDCDLIIFEKKGEKYKSFDGIVSVDVECVKAIIQIEVKLNSLKNKSKKKFKSGKYVLVETLKRQREFCKNVKVFVIFCRDRDSRSWKNEKYKKGQKELDSKIKEIRNEGIDSFVLDKKSSNIQGFGELIYKLKEIIK